MKTHEIISKLRMLDRLAKKVDNAFGTDYREEAGDAIVEATEIIEEWEDQRKKGNPREEK